MAASFVTIHHQMSLDDSLRLLTHNLKVTGSNPVPATSFIHVTKRLRAALWGGFCVSKTRGSTVEAREKEIVRATAQQKTMNLA